MSNTISIPLTEEQVQKIQPLIAEVIPETPEEKAGMILGTVTVVNGEIVVGFEAVSRALGLKIIEIAGGKNVETEK